MSFHFSCLSFKIMNCTSCAPLETVNYRTKIWCLAHEIWESPTEKIILTMDTWVFNGKYKIHFDLILFSETPHL